MKSKTWPKLTLALSLALIVDSCLFVFGFFIENSRGVDILRPQRKKDPDIAEDGALGQGDAFFQLKKASFRILFLRYELRLILLNNQVRLAHLLVDFRVILSSQTNHYISLDISDFRMFSFFSLLMLTLSVLMAEASNRFNSVLAKQL